MTKNITAWVIAALVAGGAVGYVVCENGTEQRAMMESGKEVALSIAMRELWAEHMEWTYATVAAFVTGSEGLQPTIDRLLQNQDDLGDAIKPYYGNAAGEQLSKLLRTHITNYVPVLTAAKAGDQAALATAVAVVHANGKEVASFLAGANPNWELAAMEKMMKTHNDQTLQYATYQLQGRYANAIDAYGKAEEHMRHMADVLTQGIVKQFPDKF